MNFWMDYLTEEEQAYIQALLLTRTTYEEVNPHDARLLNSIQDKIRRY
jgi:hypothetical protein